MSAHGRDAPSTANDDGGDFAPHCIHSPKKLEQPVAIRSGLRQLQ
jgi:hypothetical protein